jgi:hypothetical protein
MSDGTDPSHYIERRDPTQNMLLFLDKTEKRLDDLIMSESKLRESELKRFDDIIDRRFQRIDERFKMHDEHGKELAVNEKTRVDDIIENIKKTASDDKQIAVETASNLALRVQSTADTASKTTQDNADNMRKLVDAKAEETTRATVSQFDAVFKRLVVLEEAKATSIGNSSLSVDDRKHLQDLQAAELIRKGQSGMTTPLIIMIATAISGTLATIIAGVVMYFITRH